VESVATNQPGSEPGSAARVVRAEAMPAGTPEVPALVLGAGACGLTAALALRERGLEVLVVERDASPSGSTALSSGLIPAAGTPVQRAAGVADDSPATFAADIQAKALGLAAEHLVAAYTAAVPCAMDMLMRRGLRFELLDGFLYPGHSRLRMHAVPERSGAALIAGLLHAVEAAGAMFLGGARAEELWVNEGSSAVLGIGLRRPDGALEHVACSALLLACNGFGGNPVLVAELLPALRDAPFAGHGGNDGTALLWGRGLGAALADLHAAQGHGSWVVPGGALMSWAVMSAGGVQVNLDGARFHDERCGYSEAAVAVLAQPGGTVFNVCDERGLALARQFPDFREAEALGAVRSADDAGTLARRIGVPQAEFVATLAETTLTPPLHAVRVTGALFHTQGGLDVDERCRVRLAAGGRVPKLWAAGGAARGVSGPGVEGYLSGNGLLSAVAGGWIAAQDMAHCLGAVAAPCDDPAWLSDST
jgi:fumarate reductase flavoprotein subunit